MTQPSICQCSECKRSAKRDRSKQLALIPPPPPFAALARQCDQFNSRFPVGQAVTVRRDNGECILTVTRSPAEVLSGHSAVIWIDGISGCYLLDRITPVSETAS